MNSQSTKGSQFGEDWVIRGGYTDVQIYIYIYIYIEREREGERDREIN